MAFIKPIGKIDISILEKEFGQIRTDVIIITDERIKHIKERHPDDYTLFQKFGKESVENPNYIIKDGKNHGTVFMVKNSIYRLRERNLRKMLEKNVSV